jgi:RNA polymerase sigma-70 factor (ECF subfamily)
MRRYRSWSDGRLLAATRAGDADAFGVFFARHSLMVLTFMRRRTGSAEDAADLTAETFAAALLSVHRGRAEHVAEGAAWLIGIGRNKLVDSYRAGRLHDVAIREIGLSRVPLSRAEMEEIDAVAGADHSLVVAIEALPPEERRAILERIVLERDYDAIASSTLQTAPAVRKRVSRGLARLRNTLGVKT